MTEDPKIIVSPLSCKFTEDSVTVDVQIYKLEGGERWSLELVDEENNSTVWQDLFPTDEAAWQEFQSGVTDIGLVALLQADEGDGETIH